MKKVFIFFMTMVLLAGHAAKAQDAGVIEQYIATYQQLAIDEMKRTGVPASIKLAQGIHETMAGTSVLVQKSNNHFGIKCKSNWTGESVSHDDDARGECFRKYGKAEDSYRDHSDFLKNSTRYSSLFTLDPLDYKGWANGLKKAGYATNPRYPLIIIRLIEDYHLQDYSLIALGKMEPKLEEVAVIPLSSDTTTILTAPVPVPAEEVVKETVGEELEKPARNYPSGPFRINDCKVIYATRETPLLVIAQQYEIPLSRLFEYNELEEMENLDRDRLLFLQRKKKTGQSEFHLVTAGENLKDIAQQEGIRLESLLEYNQLKEHMVPAAGEKLYLKKPSPVIPKLAKRQD